MQWLLDANLSYRLVRQLSDLPATVLHVSRTGLAPPADDRAIWQWAKVRGYLVVTNDEDFYRLAGTQGFPPKLVMLRTGNQSSRYLAELLRSHYADIQALCDAADTGTLEIY